MNFEEAIKKIEEIVENYSAFKIGKTGQELEDRFTGGYDSEWDKIFPVCKSEHENMIDNWEKKLIIHFQNDKDYKNKCSNISKGGGDMDDDSGIYRIYVVVKK